MHVCEYVDILFWWVILGYDGQECKYRDAHLNFYVLFQCNGAHIDFLTNSKHAHLVILI
jgi:hypothetical protein